jgi:hypothetical protein
MTGAQETVFLHSFFKENPSIFSWSNFKRNSFALLEGNVNSKMGAKEGFVAFLHRIVHMFALSLIVFFYSETAFWSFYRPSIQPITDLLSTWIVYFLCIYFCCNCVWSKMRVQSSAAAIIVGCLYGWIIEGNLEYYLQEY